MLYHFSITPDVFDSTVIAPNSPEALAIVEVLRGIADNGLLADLHAGAWKKVALRSCEEGKIDPNLRDKLRSCFSVISNRNRMVRHPKSAKFEGETDFCWLHRAMERHLADPKNPFQGIFSTDFYIEASEIVERVLVPIQQVLDHECWVNRSKVARFTKTEDQLRKALRPILRYAQKIVLIDPYMTCRKDRFFNTVQHCADLLGYHDGVRHPGIIHIHAGDPALDSDVAHRESSTDRLSRWEQDIRPLISQWGHKFEVFLWRNRAGGKTFHDRYLITDQCGVRAPGGLDFITDGDKANISSFSLLEATEISDILNREFHLVKGPYLSLGSKKCT